MFKVEIRFSLGKILKLILKTRFGNSFGAKNLISYTRISEILKCISRGFRYCNHSRRVDGKAEMLLATGFTHADMQSFDRSQTEGKQFKQ